MRQQCQGLARRVGRLDYSEAQSYEVDEKKGCYFKSTSGITSFTLTEGVVDTDSWVPDLLESRQFELLEKLAVAWDIGRDSVGTDLARLTEGQLASTAEPTRNGGKISQRVTLAELLTAGLLEASTELIWNRPRVGQVHHASVTSFGQLLLDDGRSFETRAAKEAAGVNAQDGWEAWTLPDGRMIGELRAWVFALASQLRH